MNNRELIEKAAAVVKAREYRGGMVGDVGCALFSEKGEIYTGVCADIGSNVFCAEQNAIGSMITIGEESRISAIVSTWKDKQGAIFVIAPCGNCRQFMLDIDEANLDCNVILDSEKTVKLKELLPHYDSWLRQGD